MASLLVRFIRAPEWMTTRPAPIQSGRPAGPGDVADGLFQALGIGIGQVDKVRGVEGQGDPRPPGPPDPACRAVSSPTWTPLPHWYS